MLSGLGYEMESGTTPKKMLAGYDEHNLSIQE